MKNIKTTSVIKNEPFIYQSDLLVRGQELGFNKEEIETMMSNMEICIQYGFGSMSIYHSKTDKMWDKDSNILQIIIDSILDENALEEIIMIHNEWT